MRRNLLVAVLALGAILGFGSGFAHLHHRHHGAHHGRCCDHARPAQESPPPASP